MVNFINEGGSEGISITQFNQGKLFQNITNSVEKCVEREDVSVDLSVANVYVVGSLARGTANRKSDADIVLSYSGETMVPRFRPATTIVTACLNDMEKEVLTERMEKAIDGFDLIITSEHSINKWLVLERFYTDGRTGEEFGDEAVYDLRKREYVGKEKVKRMADKENMHG